MRLARTLACLRDPRCSVVAASALRQQAHASAAAWPPVLPSRTRHARAQLPCPLLPPPSRRRSTVCVCSAAAPPAAVVRLMAGVLGGLAGGKSLGEAVRAVQGPGCGPLLDEFELEHLRGNVQARHPGRGGAEGPQGELRRGGVVRCRSGGRSGRGRAALCFSAARSVTVGSTLVPRLPRCAQVWGAPGLMGAVLTAAKGGKPGGAGAAKK